MVLVDIKDNHRVFLGPRTIVINENKQQKETSIWNKVIEKASEALALNEFFGPLYRNVVLGTMTLLSLFGDYLLFLSLNPFRSISLI